MLLSFLEEYAKHSALNFGQALHGLRYFYSHPDVDPAEKRGSARHIALSALLRTKRLSNDLFFASIPPHWHHTKEELRGMKSISMTRWFMYGYKQWSFTETGESRTDLDGREDRRWDSRCKNPHH